MLSVRIVSKWLGRRDYGGGKSFEGAEERGFAEKMRAEKWEIRMSCRRKRMQRRKGMAGCKSASNFTV